MAKRFVTRIELTPQTRTILTDLSHGLGMTQVALLSRLVQWFASQPEVIQGAVMGVYPSEIAPDVARMLLRRMVDANAQKNAPAKT